MNLARWIEQAWYQGAWWLWLLLPLEHLFRAVILVRRALYTGGFLACYRAPVPVIVVGNISLGGTGKTPTVIALARELEARNFRVGIVSAGVGRVGSAVHLVTDTSTVDDCGDEALLIYERTGCPCAVAKKRPLAIQQLTQHHSLDVILSDDGLQHYAMTRDMEIVLYDVQAAFGNGRCLPMGPLREPLSRLAQADFVFARKAVPDRSQAAQDSDDPNTVMLVPTALINVTTGEKLAVAPDSLDGPVFAISGIGRPQQFQRMLEMLGFNLDARVFDDHHRFVQRDLDNLQHLPIIMTEKDAVKCRGLSHPSMWYLEVEALLPNELVTNARACVEAGPVTA